MVTHRVRAASSVSSVTLRVANLSRVSGFSSTLLGSFTTRRPLRSTPLRSSGSTMLSVSAPVIKAAPFSRQHFSRPSAASGGRVSALGRFIR